MNVLITTLVIVCIVSSISDARTTKVNKRVAKAYEENTKEYKDFKLTMVKYINTINRTKDIE